MRSLILCLIVLISGSIDCVSQSKTQPVPTGCEYNTAVLDGVTQQTGPDELIIVIARLGPKDTKPNLNNRRLHNVRSYLSEFLTDSRVRRRPETIVLAEGERASDYGSVEFYVEGKLFHTLKLLPNSDLSLANCAWEPPETPCPQRMRNLYPCKDKYGRLLK